MMSQDWINYIEYLKRVGVTEEDIIELNKQAAIDGITKLICKIANNYCISYIDVLKAICQRIGSAAYEEAQQNAVEFDDEADDKREA